MVKKHKKHTLTFVLFAALALILTACAANGAQTNLLKVGHTGGNLYANLYAADYAADLQQFRSSADIAYALLSETLDAGFVEADKIHALALLDGFEKLSIIGKVTYPYGATLVLRKGLNLRLQELDGLTIAVSSPNCSLFEAFVKDAERLGADLSGVAYEYMTFEVMLPALEARAADAAIIKGFYSAVALHEGNIILYQNWEVEPGDDCCPPIIDQVALVLLARRDKLKTAQPFADSLIRTQTLSLDELRRAVADNTALSLEILQGYPVPEFVLADDDLIATLLKHNHNYRWR